MIAIAGFSVGRYPDCPFSGDRTFMLAYSATDASLRINIRYLKPDQDLQPASGREGRLKRNGTVHLQPSFPVADDAAPWAVSGRRYDAVIIAGRVFGRFQV